MGLTSAIGIQRVRSKGRRADQTAKPRSLLALPLAHCGEVSVARLRSNEIKDKLHFGRPDLMRRGYSAPCFRTVSSPLQNGFMPKKRTSNLRTRIKGLASAILASATEFPIARRRHKRKHQVGNDLSPKDPFSDEFCGWYNYRRSQIASLTG